MGVTPFFSGGGGYHQEGPWSEQRGDDCLVQLLLLFTSDNVKGLLPDCVS